MHIRVNGVNLFYERQGQGQPLLLLHGNGESGGIFDVCMPELAQHFAVYAVDSRCHGRSEDPPEISYDAMAEDMIAFITALNLEKPIFYGFSDGGIVGLLVAIKQPELLRRLIVSGANLNPQGLMPWALQEMEREYEDCPHKLTALMLREPNITSEDLRRITVPVDVLAGEQDLIRPEHTAAIAMGIPHSHLRIIPQADHSSYIVHSRELYPILMDCIRA